jgi:hypothetical protein
MQVQRSSSAIEMRFVIATLAAKTVTSFVIKDSSQTNEQKQPPIREATPKYARERTWHSDFNRARSVFVDVSRSCHSATCCREERWTKFFDERVHVRVGVKDMSAPMWPFESLSDGARNIFGRTEGVTFAMQVLFWVVTVGSCAAWTALGYVLARLI